MGTVASGTEDTRAGEGSISITHSSLPNTSMLISDMGNISIEYDMEEDTEQAENILFTPGNFEFKVFDKLGNGDSLFSYLDSIPPTDDIDVSFSFTTDGGESWTDELIVGTNDVGYNRLKRELTFDAHYDNVSFTGVLSDIIAAGEPGTATLNDNSDVNWFCMAVGTFINIVFNDYFPSGTNIINPNSFPLVVSNDDVDWVILRANDGNVYKQKKRISEVLYRIAAADGSVVASMMGYNFFTNRLDTSQNQTLSEDDLEVLDIGFANSNYRNITILLASRIGSNSLASWLSIKSLYQESEGFNPHATKSLFVNYVMQELHPVSWDSTNSVFTDDGFAFTSDTGANYDADIKQGDIHIPVDSDPSLVNGDHVTINNDITASNIVDEADGNRIVTVDPIRSNYSNDSSVKNIHEYVNTGQRSGLATNAANSYAKAYGADGSRLIEINILDVDSLKPYESFSLDSSFPSHLQGATYRPSFLEYNLQEDKITVEAYQIG